MTLLCCIARSLDGGHVARHREMGALSEYRAGRCGRLIVQDGTIPPDTKNHKTELSAQLEYSL